MHILLDLLFSTLVHMCFLIFVAKVLTLERRFFRGEMLYIVATSLLFAVIRIFVLQVRLPNLSVHVFDDMMFSTFLLLCIPFVFMYFYKVRLYPGKQAAILMSAMMSIVFISDLVIDLTFKLFFPGMRLHSAMTPLQYPAPIGLHFLLHNALAFALTVLLIKVTTPKLWKAIKRSSLLQNIFIGLGLVILFAVAIIHLVQYSEEYVLFGDGVPWADVFVFFFVCFLLMAVFLNTRINEQKRQDKESEQLRHYTNELERQQNSIRKFKHDYLNILLSMRGFIENGDLAGLKKYYSSKVEAASEVITKDSFVLNGLEKIKVQEIKSLLAAKLMMTQNMDMDVRTTFEVSEDIDRVATDSVVLVRMLGIIMDNAAEALAELKGGELFVSVLKWEAGITFIVRNTCRPDTPPLQQLWKPGFTTKGESRGLGLVNLSELVDSYPNIALKTSIKDGVFSQELLIRERS